MYTNTVQSVNKYENYINKNRFDKKEKTKEWKKRDKERTHGTYTSLSEVGSSINTASILIINSLIKISNFSLCILR
jgi:hypothetical protein